MSDFFARMYFGNTMGQWLTAAGIIIGAVLVGRIIYWVFGRFIKRAVAKAGTRLVDVLVDLGEEPLVYAVTVTGIWVAKDGAVKAVETSSKAARRVCMWVLRSAPRPTDAQ